MANELLIAGDPIVAWHFAPLNRRLRYGDERRIVKGVIFKTTENPVLCKSGFHGSLKARDALWFAPGCVLSRTEHSGTVLLGKDKLVSTVREHVAVVEATDVVIEFGRLCIRRADRYVYAAAYAAADAAYAAADAAYAAYTAAYAAYTAAYAKAAYAAEAKWQNEMLESMLFDLIQREGGV